ncbi:unnamed protein product [Spirodela intermedia]|uniref:non-specific serine/threonine protein kinase n=1 Tax=Spirodela intermedia TaxID=51605 RepID=A0ABN7EBM8_SPIIN|nr:unnamed protein product [Spirodela intermedia]
MTAYADGLAFFLPLGEFTLFNSSCVSQPANVPVLAVEFDTFKNPSYDETETHVGIDLGCIKSIRSSSWESLEGQTRATIDAVITYDAGTTTLTAIFSGSSGYNRNLPYRVDLGFAGTTGAFFERHVIHSWSFNSKEQQYRPSGRCVSRRGNSGNCSGFGVFLRPAEKGICQERGTGRRHRERELDEGKGPRSFSYSELARATRNFAPEEKLGRGGFGDVYRGILNQPKMVVAIKRVAKDSRQGKKEYVAEVKVISRVRHRNLVQLVGWCHEKGELLLAYEYMPNGSLDAHLYNDGGNPAALGDFGLARLVDHGGGMETTAVAGTMGYLAPETATTGRASKESDVYSFGVLALEIAGGLVSSTGCGDLYGKGVVLEAADERLGSDFDWQQMERLMVVGLCCAHPDHHQRPSMRQVISILLFEMPCLFFQPRCRSHSTEGFQFMGSTWPASTGGRRRHRRPLLDSPPGPSSFQRAAGSKPLLYPPTS